MSNMSPAHSSTSSPEASAPTSRRQGRGLSKKPQSRQTITAVNAAGVPILPKQAVNAFRTMVGIVARERIEITYNSWKNVPDTRKRELWTEILASFEFPEEHLDAVQQQTYKAACKAWKNFKSTLVKKYVETDETPLTKYPFLEPQWEEFKAMKTTEDFKSTSVAHKALQAKNTHPHRLGTAGYAGKIPQWSMEDELTAAQDIAPPFSNIPDDRARNWLRARSSTMTSGEVSFRNPADQQVSQRLVRYRSNYVACNYSTTSYELK